MKAVLFDFNVCIKRFRPTSVKRLDVTRGEAEQLRYRRGYNEAETKAQQSTIFSTILIRYSLF